MGLGKIVFFSSVMVLLACGQQVRAGAFRIRTVTIDKKSYLLFNDVARFYGMVYSRNDKDIRCQSRYSLMTFAVGDRRCEINRIKVSLCLPVKQQGKHVFISETDFRLTLDPVLRQRILKPAGVRRIVIDAGHGGKDAGALGKNTREKDINLRIAKLAAASLKKRGYEVYLTRTGDTFVSLDQRVKTTGRLKPDVFVSIHANSAGATSAKGVETYAATPAGTQSTNGTSAKGKGTPGNKHDRENMRLAYELQRYLLHYTKAGDRGVKRANFVVIRDAACPSALVETGFLSNRAENKSLAGASYQRLLASGIIQGIIAYDKALRAK